MNMNKKYKIGLCGSYTMTIPNGQFYRTESVSEELKKMLPMCTFMQLDYSDWKKKPIYIFFSYLNMLKHCDYVIVFPDENAVKAIIPLAGFFKYFFRSKVFYVVIGGWLPVFMDRKDFIHKLVTRYIYKIDILFVQTEILKKSLEKKGLPHLEILNNFRLHDFTKFKFSELSSDSNSLKTFFLSRIEPLKGVEEMIQVICNLNNSGKTCTLDIYGGIQPGYEKKFAELCSKFPSFISYKGALCPDEINSVICNYDLQLFPTKYKTEGFPGSILDSFYAGVPVLASKWNSANDILENNIDSVIFDFGDFEDMEYKLRILTEDREFLNNLKLGCRKKGNLYRGDECIKSLLRWIG